MDMSTTKNFMILGLVATGAGLLIACACNGFDGVQGFAGAACFWVAARGVV